MLPLVALIVLPYLTFVFLAETFNPFSKPHNRIKRAEWKNARRWALAVFCGCCCSIYLLVITSQNIMVIALIGVSIATALGVFLNVRNISDSRS